MRKSEIDMCRIVACIMVITHHAIAAGWNISPTSKEWSILNAFAAIAYCGVPLFFMISGAVFLSKPQLNVPMLYKKNVFRLLQILVIWSAIYVLVEKRTDLLNENIHEIIVSMIDGPFHLWYIPALIMVYLTFPLVHCAIHSGKLDVRYIVILFLALFVVKDGLLKIDILPDILVSLLNKAEISYFRYLFFSVLGYWLSTLQYPQYTSKLSMCLFVALVVVTSWINKVTSVNVGKATADVYGHFSIFMVCIDCTVFIFFQSTKQFWGRFHKTIAFLSGTTLGIYLIHPMVLGRLSKMGLNVLSFNPLLAVPAVVITTAMICAVCIIIMKKIPVIRRMV